MKWIGRVVATAVFVSDGLMYSVVHGSSHSLSDAKPEAAEAVLALASSSLLSGIDDATKSSPKAKTEAIEAILALAKSSVSNGQDTLETLKNALVLFSEFKGNDRVDSALAELLVTTLGTMESSVPMQCNASEAGTPDTTAYVLPSRHVKSYAERFFTTYADRHIRRLEQAVQDTDCMEREFDVSEPDFDPAEAAIVFGKCRLLVLRNVFSKSMLQEYRQKYDDYVYSIHTGKIDRFNTKTTDSFTRDIVQGRGRKRHDIILPQWLTGAEFTRNPSILDILRNDHVLGPDMFLNHLGSVISESGAPSMEWHEDTSHIWSRANFETRGIGGHDLPPYALSMFVPLYANGTHDHGPTEYCVGSSHLDGLPTIPTVKNITLVEEGSVFSKMRKFRDAGTWGACPPEHWRAPLLDMGDAILFDYQITHRGGANRSPESRALLFAMYSRLWFRDGNFDATESEEEEKADDEATRMRHAVVDESAVEHSPHASSTIMSLENFAGMSEDTDEDSTVQDVEFFFTNQYGEDVLLSFDDGIQEEIAPRDQWFLAGKVGSTLWAHDKEGHVVDSWTVAPDQLETVLVDRSL